MAALVITRAVLRLVWPLTGSVFTPGEVVLAISVPVTGSIKSEIYEAHGTMKRTTPPRTIPPS